MLVETDFLASGICFLSMSQIFLKDSFVPCLWEMHFSIKKKKQCFLFRAFFLASGNQLQRSLFKTLITAISNHFIWFFRYYWQWKQFFPSRWNVFLNKSSFLANRNCLVEVVFFCLAIFLLVETRKFSFWKIIWFLLVKTDFLSNGNRIFFHF